MDSFEFNKIAGGILLALLFYMGVKTLANALYAPTPANPNAYVVEIPEDTNGEKTAKTAKTEDIPDIAELLATANAAKGMKIARKCVSCHEFNQSGKNKIGPALWQIIGRDIASIGGFAYSKALQNTEGSWDIHGLDAFLANPKKYIKGTNMAFAGLRKPSDRADIIAYLDSLK